MTVADHTTIQDAEKVAPWNRLHWVALTVCIMAALALFAMPQIRFANLHYSFFDLGQYATFHHAVAFGGVWSELVRGHAHLIAVIYVAIYKLFPGNATLLVLQSVVVIASTSLYVAYWRRLDLPIPAIGALLYLLSFSVWFSAMFEFHFEHLIFPLIFGFFLVTTLADRLTTQISAVLIGLTLCTVKEVYPLTAAMLGVYLVLSKRWWIAGTALFVMSVLYFFVLNAWVIPYFSDDKATGELWERSFGYLGSTITEMIVNVASRPWLVFNELLAMPRKILYVVVLFGALAFVPLRKPLVLLPALPILGISLLSHNVNHFYLGHQYTAAVTAVLFIATTQALAVWRPAVQYRVIGIMLLTTLATQVLFGPSPISRLFWSTNIWNYHWSAYWPNERDRRLKALVEEFIPSDESIVVSMQNAINLDRLSDRTHAFAFPDGVFEPVLIPALTGGLSSAIGAAPTRMVFADYVVLDRQRPLSFRDDICIFDRQAICRDPAFVARFDRVLGTLLHNFKVLHQDDGLIIVQRRQGMGYGANENGSQKAH